MRIYKKFRGDKFIKKNSFYFSKEPDAKGNMLEYLIIDNNGEDSSKLLVYGELKAGDRIKFTYGNYEERFSLNDEEYFFKLLDISK